MQTQTVPKLAQIRFEMLVDSRKNKWLIAAIRIGVVNISPREGDMKGTSTEGWITRKTGSRGCD